MKRFSILFQKITPALEPLLLVPLIGRIVSKARARRNWHAASGWDRQVDTDYTGWNRESVLEAYKEKWAAFIESMEGTGPLGISHESAEVHRQNVNFHNLIMSFGYVLALAAHGRTSLSLLDWGGGIGHYYVIVQKLFPSIKLEYHCKDTAILCSWGKRLFPEAYFYTDETCLDSLYDLVFASASLHYSYDWAYVVKRLADAVQPDGYLFITRLPIVKHVESFVHIQRAYGTHYQGWCLNQHDFLRVALETGMVLVREFITGEMPTIYGAPEQCEYRGYLFRVRSQSIKRDEGV